MCASLRFQRMATNVDGCVLITEISSTETAAVTQNTSLPSWNPRAPKHCRSPRCVSPQVSTWLCAVFEPFIVPCVKVSITPQKRCFCHQGMCSYPWQPWTQGRAQKRSSCLTLSRTCTLTVKPCESRAPEICQPGPAGSRGVQGSRPAEAQESDAVLVLNTKERRWLAACTDCTYTWISE